MQLISVQLKLKHSSISILQFHVQGTHIGISSSHFSTNFTYVVGLLLLYTALHLEKDFNRPQFKELITYLVIYAYLFQHLMLFWLLYIVILNNSWIFFLNAIVLAKIFAHFLSLLFFIWIFFIKYAQVQVVSLRETNFNH